MSPALQQYLLFVLDARQDELERSIHKWFLRGGRLTREQKDLRIHIAREQLAVLAQARAELKEIDQ